jgi:GNAT superfamily N-acetyltransferase
MLLITRATTLEHFQQVRALRAAMGRWDAAESQRLGLDPQEVQAFFYSPATDDQTSLRENAPPHGRLLLATFAGTAIGCAAFRRLDANACELHHVYVRDEFRGKHVGRLMVEQLVATARDSGYATMRLETTTFMNEARALYASIGFKPRDPYYAIPKVFESVMLFMELPLIATSKVSDR